MAMRTRADVYLPKEKFSTKSLFASVASTLKRALTFFLSSTIFLHVSAPCIDPLQAFVLPQNVSFFSLSLDAGVSVSLQSIKHCGLSEAT
jgi:hypothetical protein